MRTKKRRNGRWLKEKSNRRLQKLRDELWQKSRQPEYVELDTPIFAGWEIKIALTESGKNRKDSKELQAVLNVLNLSMGYPTKNIELIKDIRRNKYDLRGLYYSKHNGDWEIQSLNRRHIRYNSYHNLPEELKRWFYPDPFYKYSNFEKPYYTLGLFPFYECRLVITKAFYKYKKLFDNIAQSEYDKLDNRLYLIDRKTWGNRGRDSFVKANKAAWKNSMRDIVRNQYTPDEIIDNCAKIFRNTNNNRSYGYS